MRSGYYDSCSRRKQYGPAGTRSFFGDFRPASIGNEPMLGGFYAKFL
jgi:hypothetical protein